MFKERVGSQLGGGDWLGGGGDLFIVFVSCVLYVVDMCACWAGWYSIDLSDPSTFIIGVNVVGVLLS